MNLAKANAFIDSLLKLRESATDEMSLNAPAIYPAWKGGVKYKAGERVLHNGTLYRVLQDHTSQEGWQPEAAASLFAKVLIPEADVIPEWEQPNSTNPYMTGDKVTYNGSTYISTVDNNVWKPGEYGWEIV